MILFLENYLDQGETGEELWSQLFKIHKLIIIMESENETRRHNDKVSSIEMSEGSSFICNNESLEDTDNDEKQTSNEQADEKETIEDTECREDKTKESLEDEEYEQYLKINSIDGNTDASDDTDEENYILEESGTASSSGGDDVTREQSSVSSTISKANIEKQEKCTSDLEVLLEPGRRGWIREVIYSRVIENHITYVTYLSPLDNDGRKSLQSTKEILDYLAKGNQVSDLTIENFCITRKVLGLGSEFEVTRKSRQNHTPHKQYQQFFTIVKGSSPPTVSCTLCGIEGKVQLYDYFSTHMRKHHLPDETCSKCNNEIPSNIFSKHNKVCDGSKPKLTQRSLKDYSRFFTKLGGAFPSQVSCNLCSSTVLSLGYSIHFKTQHMPRPICPKCNRDFSHGSITSHLKLCDGTGTRCTAPTRFNQFYTELEDTSSPLVSCKLCDEQLVEKKRYRSHFNTFHRPSYECPTCNKAFRYKRSMDWHMKYVHERQKNTHEYLTCKKTFMHKRSIDRHMKSVHEVQEKTIDGQKKTHECPTCKKTFIYEITLAEHIKRGHEENNKTYKCLTYNKTLRYESNMDEHIKKVHKEQKQTCPKCQKKFKHVKLHMKFCGVLQEICPTCKKKTLRLKVHMKTCGGRSKKFTRAQLIIEAISKSEEEKLTVSGIHSFVIQNYPSYRITKSTISSVLSSKK